MKLYTKMPLALKPFYQKELTDAENDFEQNHFQQSWFYNFYRTNRKLYCNPLS